MAKPAEQIALRTDFSLLIDGKLEGSAEHLEVINPALGAVFARCPAATREHLDKAVRAARAAFPAAEKGGDESTADLLTQRLQVHEKTAWMLRSLLK